MEPQNQEEQSVFHSALGTLDLLYTLTGLLEGAWKYTYRLVQKDIFGLHSYMKSMTIFGTALHKTIWKQIYSYYMGAVVF